MGCIPACAAMAAVTHYPVYNPAQLPQVGELYKLHSD